MFRDLIFVDGVLKFIEIEHGVRVPERPSDPWDNDVLYDSDLNRFREWSTLCKRGAYTLFICEYTLYSGTCGISWI